MKSLAIAAGAGVAIGICTTATNSRRAPARSRVSGNEAGNAADFPAGTRHEVSADSLIDIEPLLNRLEAIERRFDAPAHLAPPPNVSELTRRIDAQEAELERLRAMVDQRATAIRSQLEAEMEERHQRSFAALEQKVEIAIADRIAAVERKLMEHSDSVEDLRARAQDTDANLKRLIVAIEKLVERTAVISQPTVPATPPPLPTPVVVPFEAHLSEARRSALFAEEEPKKPRFPMARIFGMIALATIVGSFAQILS